MKRSLSIKEITYIEHYFGFGKLLGIEETKFVPHTLLKHLEKNNLVNKNGDKYELDYELRYIFSAWSTARYSFFRPDAAQKDNYNVILISEIKKCLLYLVVSKDNVEIEVYDATAKVVEAFWLAMSELDTKAMCPAPYNYVVSLDTFEKLVSGKEYPEIGFDKADFKEYIKIMDSEKDFQMILSEDHVDDIGCLIKIVNTENGIYMLKHITSSGKEDRMVLSRGTSDDIVNSFYNF